MQTIMEAKVAVLVQVRPLFSSASSSGSSRVVPFVLFFFVVRFVQIISSSLVFFLFFLVVVVRIGPSSVPSLERRPFARPRARRGLGEKKMAGAVRCLKRAVSVRRLSLQFHDDIVRVMF